MLEDKGIPDRQIWLGFTREQDGVTWRRVLDDSVVDFEGWWGGYPTEVSGHDYIVTTDWYVVWNTSENGYQAYFGCEY